ncbi:hypothetical protein X975_05581, partial [Stegodyphus mimosarum]
MDIDIAIKANRCRNICDVANELNVSISTVHNIVSNILKYRNVCCQWVPHILSDHHKWEHNNKWAFVYSVWYTTWLPVTIFCST